MHLKNFAALRLAGQSHKKDFVKSPFSQQFWRQGLDIVRRGHHKDRRLLFRHPGDKRAKNPRGRAAVALAAQSGEGLVNFIDPQNAGGEGFRELNGLASAGFRLTDQAAKQTPHIQPQQGQVPMVGDRLGRQGFASALNPHQQQPPGMGQAVLAGPL